MLVGWLVGLSISYISLLLSEYLFQSQTQFIMLCNIDKYRNALCLKYQ